MTRLIAGLVSAALWVVPAWAGATSVSMPSFWRYAHPESRALVGIDFQRLLQSDLGREMREKIASSTKDKPAWASLDLLDRVQQIFISSPGKPDGAAAGTNAPAVIAVRGDFDLEQIRKLAATAGAASDEYDSIEILDAPPPSKPGQRQMSAALVSPRLLLLGDPDSVRQGIDHYRAADPGQMSNPLFARAAELARGNDVWIVADAPPADFTQDSPKQAQFLNNVKRVEAGISLRSGLGVNVSLGTDSNQSAAKLAAGLQMMAAMFLPQAASQAGAGSPLRNLRVSTDGPRVTFALSLSREELARSLQQPASSAGAVPLRGKVSGSGSWEWSRASRGEAKPEPKPKKRVITIWGLEDGPKEIPLQP